MFPGLSNISFGRRLSLHDVATPRRSPTRVLSCTESAKVFKYPHFISEQCAPGRERRRPNWPCYPSVPCHEQGQELGDFDASQQRCFCSHDLIKGTFSLALEKSENIRCISLQAPLSLQPQHKRRIVEHNICLRRLWIRETGYICSRFCPRPVTSYTPCIHSVYGEDSQSLVPVSIFLIRRRSLVQCTYLSQT